MHPLLADARRLGLYLLAWIALATGLAGALAATGRADWSAALAFVMPLCMVYGFVALSAYYVCRGLPVVRRRWSSVSLLFAGASLLSALAWLGLGLAWNSAGRLVRDGHAFVDLGVVGWALFFAGGLVLYLLSLLAHDLQLAFDTVRAAALREAESHTLARDAELQMLRTQINPHFLFNSLNSISALTAIDPPGARAMTLDLAEFFRRTLALADRQRIALGEEVALCRHYVAIEQRRFGDRLRVKWQLDALSPACLLPPMTLQPLIENALKHGIRELEEGGTVAVSATATDGWLRLAMSNPVAPSGARPGPPGRGLGLANIRERLAVLYGSRAHLEARRSEGHFHIELTLPAETETVA